MSINPLNDISRVYLEQVSAVEEGMTMKDFKQQRSRQKQKEKRAAEKTSPTRRAGIHADKASPERAARHRANVDPDFEGNDERNYPGGKLNPKKVRKAKALGELGEANIKEEDYDRMKDRRMERGGVDGNVRYSSKPSAVGGKKRSDDEIRATQNKSLDMVRSSIIAKHGQGALLDKRTKNEGYAPGDIDQKVGAVTAIPKSEQDAARERILAKTKAKREAMKMEALDPVGQEDADIDNDGDTDKTDKYLHNRRKAIGKAIAKKRGKTVKEGFSNWRQDLAEVMTDAEDNKKIKEKKINNKIKINPNLGEAIEEIGGTLLEMVEIDEVDYIIESVYDELLGEGYGEDEIEEALEFALTEAKVTFGHDTATTEKKKKSLLDTAREKLSGAKTAAKAAVARGARKVAKGALGVARKMEGGDKAPKTAERKPSTYRGAGAGQKEKVSSGSYTPPTKKKAEKPADPWEGSATTPPKAKAKKAAVPKAKAKAPAASAPKRKRKSKLDSLLADIRSEEVQIDEKALSKQQQKFMGMVYAVKKGDMKAPSPEVAKAAAGMTTQQAKDFAKTKHKGLPEVKEQMDDSTEMSGTSSPVDDKRMDQQRKKIQLQKIRDLTVRLSAARKGVY